MKFTDRELREVASYRVSSTRLQWGLPRAFWGFVYIMLPLVLFTVFTGLLPLEVRVYAMVLTLILSIGIYVFISKRTEKLIQTEYEYIKVKYEEGR